ncbi:HEAT repeat domain-containing protein [Okeania sp. KiyG1]|uniref:HEAT repeat domain-containing protein n=1 Tax=Okeania sp. KiyG1 TaxID=2720165 RepID=UPI0019243EB4|nr:HEAT repeat domain-containing protein [Okeania sp. KiyG1]GGA55857.1 hypothetical protein CYANOKiyG1_76550 [Okeania sp. KiyG1]
MMKWLITWGATQGVGFFLSEVIREVAKRAAEDYVKYFFKLLISDLNGSLINTKLLEKATIEAIKEFLQLVKQELEDVGLDENQLEQYIEPLEKFIKNQSVLAILGSAFDNNVKILDTNKLATTWDKINRPLPDDFDWELVAKQYQRRVKKIIRESDELREILDSKNLDKLANQNTEIRPEFDLEKYQEGIREQYGNLKLESLDTSGYAYNQLKLWRMFIPQNVRESQEFLPQVHEIPKEYRQRLKETGQFGEDFSQEQLEGLRRRYLDRPIRSVLELVEDRNYQYLVILGDPGSGKSTLLQYIALQWAELPRKDLPLQPIPILIELRTYARNHDANKCQNFLDFLEKGSGITCQLPQQELHTKLQNGDAIVMFDGLDEVFNPAKREEVITDINRFTNDYKNVQIIVTSRVIGYKPQKLRDAEFSHFILQDLEAEQIEDFIQRWHNWTYLDEAEKDRKRERLKRAIQDYPAIKELAGNPLLLTMMAILNRNQELPRDRAELYNQASRVLLHQWDIERALVDAKIDPITIDYKDKQAILRRVAHFMQGNIAGLAGNLISENDLERIIKDYLKSVDINNAKIWAKVLMEQLRSRNFILCFVGAEYYAFVHRTFLEYFCAWSFVWQFKETQTISMDRLINDVFDKHWQDEKWHEVLRLVAGMIDAKFVGEIISYLMEQDGEEEKFLNLFLAGKCLFEVRSRQSIGDVGNRLLNELKNLTGYDLDYSYEPYDSYSQEIYQKNAALVREIRTQAVEVVAATWRDDSLTYTCLKQWLMSDENWDVRLEALRQIASGWKHELGILELLKQRVVSDENWDVRREALRQITSGWKHEPGILELLKQWLVSDENWDVRLEALRQIASGWKDEPGILELLKQRVVSDENWNVRREAVQQIASGWKDEPGILELLKQRVVSDENWDVRLEALRQIATVWKDEPRILELLKQWVVSDENWDVRREVVRQIATVWKDEPGILELLKQWVEFDDNSDVRLEVVRQIATVWKDKPGILELLKQRVVSDENWYVRLEALRQIATKHEPGILELLKQRVESDDDLDVRVEALRQIASGWKDEPGTLELLKQWVEFDDNSDVRREALRQIASGWKDEPGILELLKQWVEFDDNSDVRREALQQIASGWKNESGIFELFYHTALNDSFQRENDFQDNPRQTALEAIVKHYPDNPQTLPLLQDRAENDPDEQLREWAKKKLQQLEN